MRVEVIFKNGNRAYVDRSELNLLINSRLIKAFRRGDGWVRLGTDPVRRHRDIGYRGEEKRAS